MARTKRHYIPGYVWHITHRCHKREFLLKFPRDRRRSIAWLYRAKKRYRGLSVLNYMVTSNHVHLLAFDNGGRNVIPDSIRLVAGRTGQEYNVRKDRKGIIDFDRLMGLLGFENYDDFKEAHYNGIFRAVVLNRTVLKKNRSIKIEITAHLDVFYRFSNMLLRPDPRPLGYETSVSIAKEALKTGGSVYELVLEKGWLKKEELDEMLKPENMTDPREIPK